MVFFGLEGWFAYRFARADGGEYGPGVGEGVDEGIYGARYHGDVKLQ